MKYGVWLILLLLTAIPLGTATTISLDQCGSTTITSQGTGGNAEWVYRNNCISLTMRKNQYNPNIDLHDLRNGGTFKLLLDGIIEKNLDAPYQENKTPFASMQLSSDTSTGHLEYKNDNITIGYIIQANTIKTTLEITNHNYLYPNSDLWLDILYLKKAGDTVTFLQPTADGITQPLIVNDKTVGQASFKSQRLGRGHIQLDPIYTVDYSPIPGEWLKTGDNPNSNDTQYGSIVDITAGISDNQDNTNYTTYTRNANPTLQAKFSLDETSGTVATDGSNNHNNGVIGGNPILTVNGLKNTGIQLDNTNDNVTAKHIAAYDLNSTAEMMICFGYNSSGGVLNGDQVIDYRDAVNDGWEITGYSSNKLDFTSDRSGTAAKSLQTTTAFSNSNWHAICFYSGLNRLQVYVDGALDNENVVAQSGTMIATQDLLIGADHTGASGSDALDEVCYYVGNNVTRNTTAIRYNQDKTCTTTPTDYAISGNWNITYDPTYDWYLHYRKLTAGTSTIHIAAYQANTTISTTQTITATAAGIGDFNTNISSLMNYETNTAGLNFSKFRLWTTNTATIAELSLRKEANDTQPPTINQASINTTSLTCLGSAAFTANITDNLDIKIVNFTINGQNYTPNKDNDNYTAILNPTANGSILYDWQTIHAEDIAGQKTAQDPDRNLTYACDFATYINIQHNPTTQTRATNATANINWTTNNTADSTVSYGTTTALGSTATDAALLTSHSINLSSLTPNTTYYYNLTSTRNPTQTLGTYNFTTTANCNENWQAQYYNASSCRTNNTILQFKTYIDINACGTTDNLPIDNGTNETNYCNYCTPNWYQLTGAAYNCQPNGTRYIEYADLAGCYAITGLPEDAPPADQQTLTACTYNTQQYNCSVDTEPYLTKKVDYQCTLPYTGTEWKCTNTVSQFTGGTLQVNPQKKEQSTTLINLNPTTESREAFTTTNGLLNAYYTNKNLIPDATFQLTTTCTDGNTTLINEQTLNTKLRPLAEIPSFYVWSFQNIGYIIAGIILLIVIGAVLIKPAIRLLRGR